MREKQPVLITFISSSQFKTYRMGVRALFFAFIAVAIEGSVYRLYQGSSYPFYLIITYSFFFYQLYYFTRKLKKVEFDQEFLYVAEKGYEIVIPLENIKDVEIQSLGGIYKITLYDPIQSGKELFFKPSLIYPFDFKKQDEKVNILWQRVEKAKQKRPVYQRNALRS